MLLTHTHTHTHNTHTHTHTHTHTYTHTLYSTYDCMERQANPNYLNLKPVYAKTNGST